MKTILILSLFAICFTGVGMRPALAWAEAAEPKARSEPLEIWNEPLTGMEFVRVPGGCFEMGSPPEETGRSSDEGPVHRVCLDGFWMSRSEVSRAQFRAFVEASGYRTDAEREGFSWVYDGKWVKKSGFFWFNAGFDQDDRHPVVNVSWNDAEAMARWLSDRSKGRFRLPSEAQWEYACRAGSSSPRYWGEKAGEVCAYANTADGTARERFPAWTTQECEDGSVYTSPAGRFEPNVFGLFDMLGNVWEWCHDNYAADAYGRLSTDNPLFKSTDGSRVIRGGSWYSQTEIVRCAEREHLQSPGRRSNDVGFRLVKIP